MAIAKVDILLIYTELFNNCVRLDENGDVVQIHYSTRFRDTFCRQSLENVEPLYRALKTFTGLIYDEQNLVEMHLEPGVNCFDH